MLDLNRSTLEVVKEISQGNPGALSLIMRFQTTYEDWAWPYFLSDLYNRGILGSKIWELYKDVHHEHFTEFCHDVWTGAPLHNFFRDKRLAEGFKDE